MQESGNFSPAARYHAESILQRLIKLYEGGKTIQKEVGGVNLWGFRKEALDILGFGAFQERSIGYSEVLKIEGGIEKRENPKAAEGGRKKINNAPRPPPMRIL